MKRARTLLAATCLLMLPVAGCGASAATSQSGALSGESPAGPGLPTLSPAQDLRDQVARAETAITAAASQMTELATECDDCRVWLKQVGTDAATRLQLSGGLWIPWPDASEEALADLPQPVEVGEAPITPTGLVGYMHRTAMQQLEELAITTDISSDETTVLASLLAGRLAAADQLADRYEVSALLAADLLPAGASWTTVGVPVVLTVDDLGGPDSSQSGGSDSGAGSAWAEDASAAQALLDYDCVGTTLGFTDLSVTDPETESDMYTALLGRVNGLVSKGVPDQRGIRCVLQKSTTDGLLSTLLASDIKLLSSGNLEVRWLAVEYLLQDLSAWMQFGEPVTVSPGTVVAAEGSADSGGSDD